MDYAIIFSCMVRGDGGELTWLPYRIDTQRLECFEKRGLGRAEQFI